MNETFQKVLAVVLLIVTLPITILLLLIKTAKDGWPLLFNDSRFGRDGRVFQMIKFRTMIKGADKLQKTKKYQKLNEADGPVFKIKDDPRYTKMGKFLAHTGLDELPQLINIIKGDMAFVGPRPLPVSEAKKVPMKYKKRFSVLPGITSSWVVGGSHNLSFKKWMELDIKYVKEKNVWLDIRIAFSTIQLIVGRLLFIIK